MSLRSVSTVIAHLSYIIDTFRLLKALRHDTHVLLCTHIHAHSSGLTDTIAAESSRLLSLCSQLISYETVGFNTMNMAQTRLVRKICKSTTSMSRKQ